MDKLTRATRMLLFTGLLIAGLFYAKTVLMPLCLAALIAMLLHPVSVRLERKGIGRPWAALLCLLMLAVVVAGLALLLQWQLSNLTKDMSGMQQKLTNLMTQVRAYISNTFGISAQQQQQMLQKQQSSGGGQLSGVVNGIMGSLMTIMVNLVIVVVFTFLFLYFRAHLRQFILKLLRPDQRQHASIVIAKCARVTQAYLKGMGMMIVALWVLYAIGFSIAGVPSPFFFAVLCGLLEIVPFIGNLIGTGVTILVSLAKEGDTGIVLGIVIVYALVQFIQTYLLEPLVVGSEVNLNPLFTILALIVGEAIWGVPGMILAIPFTAMAKIVCDNVEDLKPYGFLLGEEKKKPKSGIGNAIAKVFRRNG